MAIRQLQSTFSFGELNPQLLARTGFEGYYKGAKRLRNVYTIPQGGVKRRFGLLYGFTVVDTGDANEPITDPNEVSGTLFDFSLDKTFLVIVRPHDRTGAADVAFDIYLNDALQATVTTSDYAINQILGLSFLKSQDRIVILHESVAPHQLVRGANDTTWTLSTINFTFSPVFDFSIIDGVSYRGAGDTFTPSATSGSGITLNASGAFYNAGHVGGLFIGGGGIFRITAVNPGGTIATGDTIEDFESTAAIKGVNALLMSVAWGDFSGGTPAGGNRGFPRLGTFFQNRLWLANSLVLPNYLWASVSGDFVDFDDSESLAVNGFSTSVGSDGNEEIQDIIGTKALAVLGAGGFYSTSIFYDTPVTPGNFFLNEQDRAGSDILDAQVIDNQVMFVDQNRQRIRGAAYDIGAGSFEIFDATLLSPQVINDPISTGEFKPENNDGSLYLTTNDDGTLALFQSLRSQSVNAWTLSTTQGEFNQVIAQRQNAYFVIVRSIGTGTTTLGNPDNAYKANEDFEGYTDITTAITTAATDVEMFTNENDYIFMGHEIPFYRLDVVLDTFASASIVPTFEYLDDTGTWASFTPTDGTAGFTADGVISWVLDTDTQNWFAQDIRKFLPAGASLPEDTLLGTERKFWIRIRRTVAALVTAPIEETMFINVEDRIHLESADFDEFTDSTEITTSDANGLVTGLTHLQGHQVYALVDDVPEGPFFVSDAGEITVDEQSSNVRVGVNYIPEIIPMPVVAQFQFSQNVYQPKHIKTIYIDYFESLGLTINGMEIPTLQLNQFQLDQRPIPATGFYDYTPMQGWDPRKEILISQELPLPFTLLGIGYRVEAT